MAEVMGIINLTPDSFSDGGAVRTAEAALAKALEMERDGASYIDIGGESTRPGAAEVDPAEEWERIGGAVALVASSLSSARVSVDTRHPETAAKAVAAGAKMINCVSAGAVPEMCRVIAESGRSDVELVIPADAGEDVFAEAARLLGEDMIVVDPMIGFGDGSPEDDAARLFSVSGLARKRRVLVGASRKRFVRYLMDESDPLKTLPGNIALARFAVRKGASIVRVHDVKETVAALDAGTDGFSVRRASLGDAEKIFALIHLNSDMLVPRSLGNIVENIDRFLVATAGRDVIGCAAYQIHPEIGDPLAAAVEIQSLAVRAPYRRKGVGRALVEKTLAALKAFSPKEAIVLTFAPEFFGALGFAEIPKTKVMHKLYTGCINCTKHTNPFTCPEIAMVRRIYDEKPCS